MGCGTHSSPTLPAGPERDGSVLRNAARSSDLAEPDGLRHLSGASIRHLKVIGNVPDG